MEDLPEGGESEARDGQHLGPGHPVLCPPVLCPGGLGSPGTQCLTSREPRRNTEQENGPVRTPPGGLGAIPGPTRWKGSEHQPSSGPPTATPEFTHAHTVPTPRARGLPPSSLLSLSFPFCWKPNRAPGLWCEGKLSLAASPQTGLLLEVSTRCCLDQAWISSSLIPWALSGCLLYAWRGSQSLWKWDRPGPRGPVTFCV